MNRLSLVAILLLSVTLLFSCGKKYRLHREDITETNSWPFARGDLAGRGAFEEASFDGQLNLRWERRAPGRPIGPLTIYNKALIYPGTKRKIRFYDLETGHKRGRLKAKGLAQTGVVMADSLAFFAVAPRRNWLRGYDLIRHKSLWKRRVKDAIPGPIIVDDRLLVSSTEGTLTAYSLVEGDQLWVFEAEHRFSAAPSFADGRLFQPADRNLLYVLAADDGHELYRVSLKGPLVSSVAIGAFVFVTDMNGGVYAIRPADGSIVWEKTLDGPIWTSPVVAFGRVYIGHSGGEVVALDARSGQEVWRYETVDVVKASPLILGRFLAVGTMAGRLLVLDADDGSLVSSAELSGAIAFGPVTDGRSLYVATQRGKIFCFGETNEPANHADQGVDTLRKSQ